MSTPSQLLDGLNPEQRAAVEQAEGPVLVLAGAGSGKTRVIIARIAYLIAKRLARPSEILAVTFTNKAADEMRERVAGVVGKGLAKEIWLSTFHSFCVRVLREEIERLGYRKNFTISSESDARTLLRRSIQDLDGLRESFDVGTMLAHVSHVKNTGQTPSDNTPKTEPTSETMRKYRKWLPEIFDRYQSALRAANSLDFDDLLSLTLKLWKEHPRVLARYQERFRYIMVDEYQDTNRVQYELLLALSAPHRNLCVVGDDDQSIYSWRGADIGNILSFEKDFPEAKVIKLEQNYRSTQTILNAANRVIANNQARRAKNLWTRLGEGRPIDWFVTGDEDLEAKEAARLLEFIRSKTHAPYRDFAILYRSNQQSRPFELAFRQVGIPYAVFGGQDFFERAEIKDLVAYLRLIQNPRDEASFLRVVNVPRRGIGDVTLHQLHDLCQANSVPLDKGLAEMLQRGGLPGNTEAGIRSFLGILAEFRKLFRENPSRLAGGVSALLDRIQYREDLRRTCKTPAQFEARWSNVEALLTALREYENAPRDGDARHPSLAGFLDDSALASGDTRKDKEEKRKNAVSLMTVHSAKGLEFPFVFIVGVEDGLMPHEKCLEGPALEEERRLFYVALTRAKRHAALFEAVSRDRHGRRRMTKTSRFIAEIPPELLCQRIRAARDMVEEHVAPPRPRVKPRVARRR